MNQTVQNITDKAARSEWTPFRSCAWTVLVAGVALWMKLVITG